MKTTAAILHTPNEPFRFETVQLEGPGEGEVLIQVKATGLCRSDLNVCEGNVPWEFPALLGHEAAGVVVECGAGVKDFAPGDHVIPFLIPRCGKCTFCASSKTNLCVEALVTLGAHHVPILVNEIDERRCPEPGAHAAAKKTAGQLGKGNPRRRKARRRINWLIRSHCEYHI